MTTKILNTSDGIDLDLDPAEAPLTSGVSSFNGQTGAILMEDTDALPEGSTNQYYTEARAKADTVVNSTAGDELDKAPSVSSVKIYSAPLSTPPVAKTDAYAMAVTDYYVTVDTSVLGSTVAITLPSAAGCVGREYIIQKTDTSFNAVQVLADGTDTYSGTLISTYIMLATQGETVRLTSNGTNWFILNRYIPSTKTSYTPSFTGFGTVTNIDYYWQREGSFIFIQGRAQAGTVTAVEPRISLPSGLGAPSAPFTMRVVGVLARTAQSTTFFNNGVLIEPSSSYMVFSQQTSTSNINTKLAAAVVSNSEVFGLWAKIPIVGWDI